MVATLLIHPRTRRFCKWLIPKPSRARYSSVASGYHFAMAASSHIRQAVRSSCACYFIQSHVVEEAEAMCTDRRSGTLPSAQRLGLLSTLPGRPDCSGLRPVANLLPGPVHPLCKFGSMIMAHCLTRLQLRVCLLLSLSRIFRPSAHPFGELLPSAQPSYGRLPWQPSRFLVACVRRRLRHSASTDL
jgi:hypothetical protein